nr:hypothetical protein Iba_chr12fCG11370 [Ipomoea batatas]
MIHCNEAAGTSTIEPIDLSIVAPCLVNRVDVCANTRAYPKHVTHIGTSLRIALASLTSSIVQVFLSSFEPSGASSALLRNLLTTWNEVRLIGLGSPAPAVQRIIDKDSQKSKSEPRSSSWSHAIITSILALNPQQNEAVRTPGDVNETGKKTDGVSWFNWYIQCASWVMVDELSGRNVNCYCISRTSLPEQKRVSAWVLCIVTNWLPGVNSSLSRGFWVLMESGEDAATPGAISSELCQLFVFLVSGVCFFIRTFGHLGGYFIPSLLRTNSLTTNRTPEHRYKGRQGKE